jgi:hypothetical protein
LHDAAIGYIACVNENISTWDIQVPMEAVSVADGYDFHRPLFVVNYKA